MTRLAPDDWLVYGCRTRYCVEVLEILWRRGDRVAALVDNLAGVPIESTWARVVTPATLGPEDHVCPVVVPLLTPGFRYTVAREARAGGFSRFPVLLDPTAVVARTAELAEGTVVNAMAVIGGASQLGRFVHVNRSASLGHDLLAEDFVTFGPACVVAGGVHVQRGAFIGAGAVCSPEVSIGANSVVGAGAVVVRDVAPGAVVVGNPASEIRRVAGYGNATVPEAIG